MIDIYDAMKTQEIIDKSFLSSKEKNLLFYN